MKTLEENLANYRDLLRKEYPHFTEEMIDTFARLGALITTYS